MERSKVFLSVKDFTEDPGPRYIRQDIPDGNTSGEAFYIYMLNKAFADCVRNGKNLVLMLDGVSGYPSSFLDEAIGELVYDFSLELVEKHLSFNTVMFARRVRQVVEETYLQWEERRISHNPVVHSPSVDCELFRFNSTEIESYQVK